MGDIKNDDTPIEVTTSNSCSSTLKRKNACEHIAINKTEPPEEIPSIVKIDKSMSVRTVFKNPTSALSSCEEIDCPKTILTDDEIKPNAIDKNEINDKANIPTSINQQQKVQDQQQEQKALQMKNDDNKIATTIFSVSGAPSRRPIRKIEAPLQNVESIYENNAAGESKERILMKQLRNPVTGYGVSSQDEFKVKLQKKKDGNPVLGLGYEENNNEIFGNKRIPPGGHSNGLW